MATASSMIAQKLRDRRSLVRCGHGREERMPWKAADGAGARTASLRSGGGALILWPAPLRPSSLPPGKRRSRVEKKGKKAQAPAQSGGACDASFPTIAAGLPRAGLFARSE